jgi:TIR domain
MSYLYEAFFSYKRDSQSDFWHQTVKDKLAYWLRVELGQLAANIFFDTEEIQTGDRWRQRIAHALRIQSASYACGLWSPYYFQSKYCVSEWLTFHQRQTLCNSRLILPASYHDGEHFPSDAQALQHVDFSHYACTIASFWNTVDAVDFETKTLKSFARDLAVLIRAAPPYSDDFPIVEAEENDTVKQPTIGRIANN